MQVSQIHAKDQIALEGQADQEVAADKTPEFIREELESKDAIAEAQQGVEEKMLNARNKISQAEAMEEKAKKMGTTIEGVTSEEDKKQLSKLAFESSFLEQEARKS